MTKKRALQNAVFVSLMAFIFSSFVLWELFKRIGPTANGVEPLASVLPFTPFMLSAPTALLIFLIARQIFFSRVQDGGSVDSDNGTSDEQR